MFTKTMEEQRKILNMLIEDPSIREISESSEIDLTIATQLYDMGLINAEKENTYSLTPALENPCVSIEGLNWLEKHSEKHSPWWKSFDRRLAVLAAIIGLVGLVIGVFALS